MKTRIPFIHWLAVWLIFSSPFFLAMGCSRNRQQAPARAQVTGPGATLEQSGAAAVPATAKTSRRSVRVPLPAGTELVPDLRTGGFSFRLLVDSEAVATVETSDLTGATSFAPEAPPSAQEQALAFGLRGSWIVGGLLLVLGLLLAWRGHGKGAGIAFIGAAATPAAAQFIGSTAGQIVGAVALTGAAGLFVAWHLIEWKKKKAAEKSAADALKLSATP